VLLGCMFSVRYKFIDPGCHNNHWQESGILCEVYSYTVAAIATIVTRSCVLTYGKEKMFIIKVHCFFFCDVCAEAEETAQDQNIQHSRTRW
jgi:hypothetical protein